MNVIYSDQPFGVVPGHSIFLAGPTPRSTQITSWRPNALEILTNAGYTGTVFVPERADKACESEYTHQIEWAYAAIQQASLVVFWVPRDRQTLPALTTHVEFGYWMRHKEVLYGRPDDAEKNSYLDWLYTKTTGKSIHSSLVSLLTEAHSHSLNSTAPQTFLTADWHLGETRLPIMQRPFANTQEQTEVLIRNHNKLVRPNDVVILNGDAISAASDVADMHKLLPQIARFNGKKMLIRGNHDRKLSDDDFKPYFELGILADGDGMEVDVPDGRVYVTHYPTQSKPDMFNCVGHIHSSWKVQLNMLNVGVDVHHFNPLPVTQVPFFIKAIATFYDQDCWCGDHPANAAYKGVRGKPGRYLDVVGEVGGK